MNTCIPECISTRRRLPHPFCQTNGANPRYRFSGARKAAPRGLTAVMKAGVGACRVKDFASRGSRGRKRANVLCLPIAFRERQWVLHRFFDGLEEAVVGAYAGRFTRHEIARSMEAHLLRGLHGARRRRRAREIPEERGRTAFPARPITSLSPRKRLRLTRLRSRYRRFH